MMYGDEDYYPGENGKSTDDFYTYGGHPDDHAIDKLAAGRKPKKIRSFGEHTPISRNDNFATGATSHTVISPEQWAAPIAPAPQSHLTSAPNAVSLGAKEAWDHTQGDAQSLAADKMVHKSATRNPEPMNHEAQMRDMDQSDHEYIMQNQVRAAGAKRPNPKGLSDAEVAKRVARSQGRLDRASDAPKTQAQRRAGLKGNNFRPEDRQGTEYAERATLKKGKPQK